MTAYLIADIDIHDEKGYEEYRRRVPAIIASHGGRYLVRGSTAEVVGRGEAHFYDAGKERAKDGPDHESLKEGAAYDLAARKVIRAKK